MIARSWCQITKQRRSFIPEFKSRLPTSCSNQTKARSKLTVYSALVIQHCADGLTKFRKNITTSPPKQGAKFGTIKTQKLEAWGARLEREKSTLKKGTALLISEDHERLR
jgi:transposase